MRNVGKVFSAMAIATCFMSTAAGAAGIEITANDYVRVGAKMTIESNVTLEDGEDSSAGKITWESSKPGVLKVNQKGVVKGLKTGKASVTATLPGGEKAKVVIKVKKKLALSSKSMTIKAGEKKSLDIAGFDDSLAKWKSSNKSVATVSKKGTVEAKSEGTATITAVAEGKKLKCTVTVKGPAKLKLNKSDVDTYIGDKTYLSAPSANGGVTWTSSNLKVAKVDSDGKVTALASGKSTITAKASNGAQGKCTINVKAKRSELVLKPDGSDSAWVSKAKAAIEYIKMDQAIYDRVLKYLGAVEQVKNVSQTRKSNMDVFTDVPTFFCGPTIYADTLYFASCIVHDAYHSKMYFDAESAGKDGQSAYEGQTAEVKCCEIQRDFLNKVARLTNDESVRSFAQNYAAYMTQIINDPDNNQYWVSWETNPY